jgi:hypothetical protein
MLAEIKNLDHVNTYRMLSLATEGRLGRSRRTRISARPPCQKLSFLFLFSGTTFATEGAENDPSRPIPPHPRCHPQRSSHDRPAVLPGRLTVEPRIGPASQIRRRHLDVWICHERPPDPALHPPRAAQVNNRAVLAASAGRRCAGPCPGTREGRVLSRRRPNFPNTHSAQRRMLHLSPSNPLTGLTGLANR